MIFCLLSILGSMIIHKIRTGEHEMTAKEQLLPIPIPPTPLLTRNYRGKKRRLCPSPLQRLLIALGCIDIIIFLTGTFSINFWLPPSEFRPLTYGNLTTCMIFGILLVYGGIGMALCNMFLSMYYYLTINCGKRPNNIRYWEYGWYTSMFLWPTSLAVAGLLTDSFAPFPHVDACHLGGKYPTRDVILIHNVGWMHFSRTWCRGKKGNEYLGDAALAESFLWLHLCHLSWRIWYMYRILKPFERLGDITLPVQRHRTIRAWHCWKEKTYQAVLYSLAYFNGFFWMVILIRPKEGRLTINNENVEMSERPLLFYILCFGETTSSGTGFCFNCIVYLMPSFRRWKQACPDLPAWMILRKLIFERETPLLSDHKQLAATTTAARTSISTQQ